MTKVLVWNKNRRVPRIHVDGTCPSLKARSVVPHRNVKFALGKAGWLPESEALAIPGAAKCELCWR